MIFNLLIIAAVAGLTYAWVTRGFFNALIHMVCAIIAGAIAFGVWEPLAHIIIDKAPSSGFLSFLRDSAWGVSIMLGFAVPLAILRVVMDSVLRANVNVSPPVNYAGAGVCGLVSAIIATGVIVVGISTMRMPAKILGYQPYGYSATGLSKEASLWVPVDRVVMGFYGTLSDNVLRAEESLARWYPDPIADTNTLRMSFGEGKATSVLSPDAVAVKKTYTVGKAQGNYTQHITDKWNDAPQQIEYLDGTNPSSDYSGGYIAGYVVSLDAGAQEKKGKVVLGAGQVRLVTEHPQTGERKSIRPFAVISQIDAANKGYHRFRFDGKVHMWSAGGASQTDMAFEFVVPQGFEPKGLMVKNTRVLSNAQPIEFASAAERDTAIEDASLMGGAAVDFGHQEFTGQNAQVEDGVDVTNLLPDRAKIQKGQHRSLEYNGDGSAIIGGDQKFTPDEVEKGFIDRALIIDRFFVTPDTVVVQVEVSANTEQSFLTREAREGLATGAAPVLIDTNGARYEPVGFFYKDNSIVHIRYTPGDPIRSGRQLQDSGIQLSGSVQNQRLILIFRPSLGVTLTEFAVGSTTLRTFDGAGLTLDREQSNGR